MLQTRKRRLGEVGHLLKVARLRFSPLSPELVPSASQAMASLCCVLKRPLLQPPWKMTAGGLGASGRGGCGQDDGRGGESWTDLSHFRGRTDGLANEVNVGWKDRGVKGNPRFQPSPPGSK